MSSKSITVNQLEDIDYHLLTFILLMFKIIFASSDSIRVGRVDPKNVCNFYGFSLKIECLDFMVWCGTYGTGCLMFDLSCFFHALRDIFLQSTIFAFPLFLILFKSSSILFTHISFSFISFGFLQALVILSQFLSTFSHCGKFLILSCFNFCQKVQTLSRKRCFQS